MFFPTAYWKRKAREALKNHWQTALLILLVVNLPSLLVQGIASFTGNDLMNRLQNVIYGAVTASGSLDVQAMNDSLLELEQSGGVWLMQGLSLLSWLITPCLGMGMFHWMQLRLAGQDGDFTTVFSRLSLFLKGIGLRLYVALMIFLSMLPGIVLSILSLIPLWRVDSSSREALFSSVNTSLTLMSLSSIVILVLGIVAALRYAPAEILMAAQPKIRIIAAARESKALMKGHKWHLLLLFLSFFLWYFLEMFLVSLCLSMFGSIAALMAEMLCSLALNAYIYTTLCAFCETLQEQSVQSEFCPSPPENSSSVQ